MRVVCGLNALLVGGFVLHAWPNVTAEADLSRVGDVAGDLAAIVRAGIEHEEDNAWPEYQRIREEFLELYLEYEERTQRYARGGSLTGALYDGWRGLFAAGIDEEEVRSESAGGASQSQEYSREEVRIAWQMVAPLAESIEEASRLPAMAPGEPEQDVFDVWISQPGVGMRHVDSVLFGGLTMAMNDAQWDEVIRWLSVISRVSNQQAKLFVLGLVLADGRMEQTLWRLNAGIHQHDLSEEDAERLLKALEVFGLNDETFERALRSESQFFFRQAAPMFDRRGRMMIWMHEKSRWHQAIQRYYGFGQVKDAVGARLLNGVLLDMPTWDDAKHLIDHDISDARYLLEEWRSAAPEEVAEEDLTPLQASLDTRSIRTIAHDARAGIERRKAVLRVMLRLEIYHARHGEWPAKLVDAMAIEETIDPTTGKGMVYERTPDDPNHQYVLKTLASPAPRGVGADGVLSHGP